MQIILCGQPELDIKIGSHELRQLRDRIAIKVNFKRLTFDESIEYIKHRLRKAGGADNLFDDSGLRLIADHCIGNPRRINILCDMSLVTGFGYKMNPITEKVVAETIADFEPFVDPAPEYASQSLGRLTRFWNRLLKGKSSRQI